MNNLTAATGTPVVSVSDNRGLAVRALNWNREQAADPLRLLVSHSYMDDANRVVTYRDPRLFTAWTTDSASPANLHTMPSLAGQLLKRESSDSGELVTLFDAAGRPAWTRDGRGTVQTVAYDELGRPESGSEQLSGSDDIRVSWLSGYGDAGPADDGSQGKNLRGINVAQYNDGGLHYVSEVALSGAVLSQTRRFLASAENLPDWQDETGREAQLEADEYDTVVSPDARGAALIQTDAAGHKLAWRYDVSGRVCYQDVTAAGGEKQILLAGITWSAAGQVLAESAGNGVTTTYGYDQQNQWLATITAQRADNTTLQALSYGYDFTGNVISLSDGSVASHYYRNEATSGTRLFTYDALYQLLSATGRENATNTGMQYSGLPVVMSPDGSQYVNYTRSYGYDDSGNLSTLKHTGAGSFTRIMTTETTSNRSVQQNDDGAQTPDEVKNWFDSNGNLLKVQASTTGSDGLAWDGSNNLQAVTLVSRSSGNNNREIYQYSGSQRVRKQTRLLVNDDSQLWSVDEVRYLPGLELRKSWQETAGSSAPPSLAEELHVVTSQAGRAGIRVLHWETGKLDGIDNNQVRWSVDDNIGSLSLELDAEGQLISREEYYPFGGTAVWAGRNKIEASYKTVRYSGKERDGTGLYYYGHRYYAPWLCRWVSADPAGEVDGLNLFRMVKNNPITFFDNIGEATFKSNVDFTRGDLIYGLAGARGKAIASINPRYVLDIPGNPTMVIDTYNNAIAMEIALKYVGNKKYAREKNRVKYAHKITVTDEILDQVRQSKTRGGDVLWDAYLKLAKAPGKFNVKSIYKEVSENINKDDYYDWHIGMPAPIQPRLLWKRGSKLGIQSIINEGNAHLHFVLDGIDIGAVARKEGGNKGGKSITASELRYLYRHREEIGERVHFYRNNIEVAAPWSDPNTWTYKPSEKQNVTHDINQPSTSQASTTKFSRLVSRLSIRRKKSS
ncbi:RHS repeat-associated core domain-containing protein [Pseudescherichia vulneris]|uniref:RHS repeat-associated core domain-containing protein n=1 Tax=Pseudescherichia vulneris TaxID=566 RepID=UPI0030180975